MPVFNNSEARVYEPAPNGDYILRVVGFDTGISKGGKTAGSDVFEVEFLIEGKGVRCWDNLIDHPQTAWKIDCFLKCMNAAPPVGQSYEFSNELAQERGSFYVNPIGLRGHARLTKEEYPVGSGKWRNRIQIYHTDKPKLPRHEEAPAPKAAPKVTPADDFVPF